MIARRPVVYPDTNALFPYYLSDFLLFLAADGAIRLVWSRYLIDEVLDAVPRRRLRSAHGRDRDKVQRQWDAAMKYFAADEVSETQWREELRNVSGRDPDDLPHAAAAIAARADVLLTSNSADFDAHVLADHGVRVMRPDAFLLELLGEAPDQVVLTFRGRAAQMRTPPLSERDYLQILAKSVPGFAAALMRQLDQS